MTPQEYKRTLKGLSVRMYSGICKRSRKKGWSIHFTKAEFDTWLFSQSNYTILFNAWEISGYLRSTIPSVDRLDASQQYIFSNMQILSCADNITKAHTIDLAHRKPYTRTIAKFSLDNVLLCTYDSIKAGAIAVNGYPTAIRNACIGTYPIAFGFKWQYI